MPAHVVRSDGEEERRLHLVRRECLEEARHAFARAPERIDVDPQPERRHQTPVSASRRAADGAGDTSTPFATR